MFILYPNCVNIDRQLMAVLPQQQDTGKDGKDNEDRRHGGIC
jgi:hypothetical protein